MFYRSFVYVYLSFVTFNQLNTYVNPQQPVVVGKSFIIKYDKGFDICQNHVNSARPLVCLPSVFMFQGLRKGGKAQCTDYLIKLATQVCDQIFQKGSYTCTISVHRFHHHSITILSASASGNINDKQTVPVCMVAIGASVCF